MTNVTCTRRLQFCAGHRVMGHESKCAHLHGHNYVVWLTAEMIVDDQYHPDATRVDKVGRVIDFSVLKYKVGTWIERVWDHGFLFHTQDVAAYRALKLMSSGTFDEKPIDQKMFPMPYNPTAENIARYLLEVVGPDLLDGTGVRLCKVRVDETENCSAEVTL